jgi:hypothetical protein
MHVWTFVAAALSGVALQARATVLEDGFELRQLTEDNFKSSTNRGLW